MADLLPSIPDTSAPEHAEPRVVGLHDEDADDVLGALSSTTARELFAAVNEKPAHPSALADRVDTTLQNCQYHLGKLRDAGLVEVVDTAYSAKGREMDVYAPADQPLVVFAGDEHDRSLLSRALGRLLGGFGVLATASVVAQGLFGGREGTGVDDASRSFEAAGGDGGGAAAPDGGGTDGDGGDPPATDATESASEGADDTAAQEPSGGGDGGADGGTDAVVDTVSPVADHLDPVGDLLAATGLEPGLAVFAIGGVALTVGVAVWYRSRAPPRGE